VSFAPPTSNGGAAITSYTATSSPGGLSKTGTSSPLVVAGLTPGTSYTFTVKATNVSGAGPASAPSAAVTPTSVPGAPTGVTATVVSATSASVGFTPPANNGGLPVTRYTVTSAPGNISVSGSQPPVTVSGLTPGVTYTFRVTASNAAGTGPASSASSPITPAGPPPAAPLITSTTAQHGSVTIGFDALLDTGGSPITGYTVTSTPGGVTATATSSPVVVSGLDPDTSYQFSIHASNAQGNGPESALTDPIRPSGVTPPVLLAYQASYARYVNVNTGGLYNELDGSETDANDGSVIVPPRTPLPATVKIPEDALPVTLDPESGRYTTFRFSWLDLANRLENNRNGDAIGSIWEGQRVWAVTTDGHVIDLYGDPTQQLDPATGDVVGSTSTYELVQTPVAWRLR
jgi:hypothetical protein